MYKSDTICAVATGLGKSAIGIIRVSGPEAISICDGIFVGKKSIANMETYTAAFGRIMDGDQMIDEAIVLVMRGKHTYTTEDTVEINLHGGSFVVRRVLELLVKNGIRIAEPGEFTKRAFLGGRIDMTEAEAVMDVINAETEKSLGTSMKQLAGKLSGEITQLREKLLYNTAYIESALDDPENYSLDGFGEKLRVDVQEVIDRIQKLISTSEEGRVIREGIKTAIVGRPNVGKSSMLNFLLGENRAIVTEIEGTTRDTLEEYADIGGMLLKLIDTAGIRDTSDMVEKIGVDKARETIESADLVMLLLDGSQDMKTEDREILSSLEERKVIALINKADKMIDESSGSDSSIERGELEKELVDHGIEHIIYTSAKTGQGVEELKALIKEMFLSNELDYNDQIYITRSRHKSCLIRANESLGKVMEGIDAGVGEDFLTIDLMDAYEALGDIIGETLEDDLADKIFSEFCMGK